jgi:hypothetical protein
MNASTLPADHLPVVGHRHLHQESHRSLLGVAPVATPTTGSALFDVVAVPVYRRPHRLRDAVAVADRANATLLLLVSGSAATAEEVACRVRALEPVGEVMVVDLNGYPRRGRVGFRTDDCPETSGRSHDAGLKRNVALLLAHQLSWDRLLFLNDDVRDFDAAKLTATAALLDAVGDDGRSRFDAAGWAFGEFPDNSVVCHAHRLAGGINQGTFVSDAALAVRMTPELPFFPFVYNEDWLFLHGLVAAGRLGFAGDDLRQDAYRPFANPRRAVSEEFGDILGEGLFALLHDGAALPDEVTSAAFWADVVARRAAFIRDILSRLDAGEITRDTVRARRCLVSALRCHADRWPQALATFVADWQADLQTWRRTLADLLPVGGDRDLALKRLGLDGRTRFVVGDAPMSIRELAVRA